MHIPALDVPRIALLGCGSRGLRIVELARISGWDLCVFDPDPAVHCDAPRVQTISKAVSAADLIILAVPDRLALVRKVVQVVQAHCPRTAEIVVLSDAHEQDALRSCATRSLQIHGGTHADFLAAPLWRALTTPQGISRAS